MCHPASRNTPDARNGYPRIAFDGAPRPHVATRVNLRAEIDRLQFGGDELLRQTVAALVDAMKG
jgi:hypothetical protein